MSDTTIETDVANVADDSITVADESTADNTESTQQAIDGEEALGDKGKKALDAMKAKWKEAERVARERDAELAELRAKVEGREAEHAKEQERRNVEAQALAKANQRIVRSEIKAAAKGVLADPEDAFTFLDLSDFEVDDDGNVDEDAIVSALTDLTTRKPYLAAQGGRFQGSADGGVRKDVRPTQLTRSDIDRMSPEQIVQAKAEGRLNDLLGIK